MDNGTNLPKPAEGGIELDDLVAKLSEFEDSISRAVSVSARGRGKLASPRTNWATFIFARACTNSMSMVTLLRLGLDDSRAEQLFDHFAFASVARTMIEACIVSIYLSDKDMNFDRWLLVKAIIDLHDATHRQRIFKPLAEQNPEIGSMAGEYPGVKKMLREHIRKNPEFAMLPKEHREGAISGREFMIGGIRHVVKEIGWNSAEYEHIAAYLSAFVHSTPVSFHRAEMHKITFTKFSPFQVGLAFAVLEWSGFALRSAADAVDDIIDLSQALEANWPGKPFD